MENNGTLGQLATFFDKLVAEQVAEEVAKQTANGSGEMTLDNALKVISENLSNVSEQNDTVFEKLHDLTKELADKFDYVRADDVDKAWVEQHTDLLDDVVAKDDIDEDWVEENTNILDDYVKTDDVDKDWLKDNTSILDEMTSAEDIDVDWIRDNTSLIGDELVEANEDDIISHIKDKFDVIDFIHSLTY